MTRGWIDWQGGDCPVPDGSIVDVELRDGEIIQKQVAWGTGNLDPNLDPNGSSCAGHAYWRNDGTSADIIAYRISKAAP